MAEPGTSAPVPEEPKLATPFRVLDGRATGDGLAIVDANGRVLALICTKVLGETVARMFAASPDQFAALEATERLIAIAKGSANDAERSSPGNATDAAYDMGTASTERRAI